MTRAKTPLTTLEERITRDLKDLARLRRKITMVEARLTRSIETRDALLAFARGPDAELARLIRAVRDNMARRAN